MSHTSEELTVPMNMREKSFMFQMTVSFFLFNVDFDFISNVMLIIITII
jgi:hypothetical protein